MNNDRVKNTVYIREIVDHLTGEIIKKEVIRKQEIEPEYFKVYIDNFPRVYHFLEDVNSLMAEIITRMTYADESAMYGGQVVYMTKIDKEDISKKIGKKVKRIEQILSEMVEKNILRRIHLGVYQVNPFVVGKGHWTNIKALRSQFQESEIKINDTYYEK